jgi:hypothetical protein
MEYVMADQLGLLSPEDYAQQQQINRQQKMAEMLMQNTQQPQGQMISGRYVAPSFFQYITPLVNAYQGKRLLEQGDIKQQALAEAIRGRNSQDLEKFIDLSQGSKDFKPAVMPQIQRDDMGNVMPNVENQVGQAPNKQAAALLALRSYDPTLKQLGGSMLSQMTKEPELVNVAPGGSLVRNVNGKVEPVFTAPEKLSPTEAQRDYVVARQQGYTGSFMDFKKYLANLKEQHVRISVGGGDGGMPNMGGQGGFDKKGNFVSTNGAIFTPVEIRKDREEVGSLINALQSISKISKEDVAASDTILGNVSEGGFKGYVAKQAGLDKVVAAQNKINAAGVMQILNNLPPGPASDKDIAMAKSSFPGYGNAKALQDWIDNTNNVLTQKVGNYEQKYGGMNWYGNANPMQAPKLSPQDQEALAWANANPKDPRSADIKKRLGQ